MANLSLNSKQGCPWGLPLRQRRPQADAPTEAPALQQAQNQLTDPYRDTWLLSPCFVLTRPKPPDRHGRLTAHLYLLSHL